MRPNILIVDPDRKHTAAIFDVLNERGMPYRALIASDREEALEYLASLPVVAVVCEAQLPSGSGVGFLAYVRSKHPQATRILMTVEPTLSQATAAINDAGVSRFLQKPLTPRALIEALMAEVPPEQPTRSGQLSLSGAFDNALARLWLATQPIVSFVDHRVVAYEALVRSDEPGLRHPRELFALAEVVGRTADLEHTIWEHAAKLVDQLPADVSLFVNVEASSLDDPYLFDADSPLSSVSGRVVLELTEHGHLHDLETAKARVAALRERGFRVAIDDFGAGQSGLNSVARLAPDVVKFDMGLIQGIESDPAKVHIVQSMCAACDELGISTICEGVESREQLEVLTCSNYLQGYLFAVPARPFPRVTWPEPVSAKVRIRDPETTPVKHRKGA
jgi:EAL domain-containing protein (putative c-di-GMP-specific phosphodiesterase class I)